MDNSYPVFSIIVPIYNTANYLHRCIDSILSQSFTDFELILVDDGSTDNSGEICDIYVKQDDRIKVFHKKNEGVSIARNVGLENVRGEWIVFVDSDDWVEVNWLEVVNQKINLINADLYTFGIRRLSDKTIYYEYLPPNIVEENITFIKSKHYKHTGCTYVFNNLIIKEWSIKFPVELKRAEDQAFLLKYISKCKSVSLIDNVLYNYYDNPASVVNQAVDNSWAVSNIVAANDFLLFCQSSDVKELFYEQPVKQLYEDFFVYYRMIKNVDKKEAEIDYKKAYKQTLALYPEFKKYQIFRMANYSLTLSETLYHRQKQLKNKIKQIKKKIYQLC